MLIRTTNNKQTNSNNNQNYSNLNSNSTSLCPTPHFPFSISPPLSTRVSDANNSMFDSHSPATSTLTLYANEVERQIGNGNNGNNGRVNIGVERAKVLARALHIHPAVLVFPDWESESESVA